MRALLVIGGLMVLLGIASIFVPFRYRERHGVDAGPISIGVTTTESRKAPPAVTAILIVVGAALMVAGARKSRR